MTKPTTFFRLHSNANIKICSLAVFVMSSMLLCAQSVELQYSNFLGMTKSIQIELCDSAGNKNPSYKAFNQNGDVFFLIKPFGTSTWTFSAKDVDTKIKEIKLIQNDKLVSANRAIGQNKGSDVTSVIVGYPKSEIDITKSFLFKNKELNSQPLSITEKLWPGYLAYTELINKSKAAESSQNYTAAFSLLGSLWKKTAYSSYLPIFSFYNGAKDSVNVIADLLISQAGAKFKREVDQFKSNITEESFASVNALSTSLLNNVNNVDSFYIANSNIFDAAAKGNDIKVFSQNITNEKILIAELYQKKMLSVLAERNYSDYQFKVYTEVLAKLLTSVDKIGTITGFDSIPTSQLKKYKSLTKELGEMGWTKNIQTVCLLLNNNIKNKKNIFNEETIANYTKNTALETQPYSTLFKAFNALVNKDKKLFVELARQSVNKITDKELLSNLDLFISLVEQSADVNDNFWSLLNSGYAAQNNESLQDAKASYEKAEKLVTSNEILYYLLAATNLKLGDRFSAEIYFKRANAANPKFILAKLYQIDFLIEDKDYESALLQTNEALALNPIWYFYFKKAQLLELTSKHDEAKTILQTNCIAINSQNYEQYLLLGDIYSSLSDAKNARESYMKAGNIKPNDPDYKKRMELLLTKKLEAAPKTNTPPVIK